jgi:hypothetical protein
MLLDEVISPPLNTRSQIEKSLLKISSDGFWYDIDEARQVILCQKLV